MTQLQAVLKSVKCESNKGAGSFLNNCVSVSELQKFTFMMNEQIKLMNTLGYAKVQELAQKKANLLYGWAESKPYLSPYIEEKEFRSVAVATIDVDPKVNVDDVIKFLWLSQSADRANADLVSLSFLCRLLPDLSGSYLHVLFAQSIDDVRCSQIAAGHAHRIQP